MTTERDARQVKAKCESLRKLIHAAFHLIDDSETDSRTNAISVDNEIAANSLKEILDALDELGIDDHEDVERHFSTRIEKGEPARHYTAPDCEWEQSQSRLGLMFVLATEHSALVAENERLSNALNLYGRHLSLCDTNKQMHMEQGHLYTSPTDWDEWRAKQPCTCKFIEALTPKAST